MGRKIRSESSDSWRSPESLGVAVLPKGPAPRLPQVFRFGVYTFGSTVGHEIRLTNRESLLRRSRPRLPRLLHKPVNQRCNFIRHRFQCKVAASWVVVEDIGCESA